MQIKLLPPIEIPLVNKFYKENKARGLAKRNEHVWVAKRGEIIAACRIQTMNRHFLLVGLMVAEQERGKGVGKQLLTEVIPKYKVSVFSFPYSKLASWYASIGFEQITIEVAPEAIKAKYIIYQAQGRDIIIMRSSRNL